MKKSIILYAIGLLIMLFTGKCGNTDRNAGDNETDGTGKAIPVNLSNNQTIELNIYFTGFSKVFLPEFKQNNIADSVLIQFGIFYNYIEHPEMFQKIAGSKASIAESMVNDTAMYYFGRNISKHQSISDVEYKSGKYTIAEASGESFRFSQLRQMNDLGNEVYEAIIEVFSASSGFTGNPNDNPEIWAKNNDNNDVPSSEGRMKAILQKINKNGKIRYILLDYQKIVQ